MVSLGYIPAGLMRGPFYRLFPLSGKDAVRLAVKTSSCSRPLANTARPVISLLIILYCGNERASCSTTESSIMLTRARRVLPPS